MSWYISAIFYSFMHASFSLINQKFKIPGAVLAIWRGFGVFVVLLPFAFFISPPTSILFYVFVCINGILSGLYDNKLFEMSAKFGGGKFLRLRPLSLITLIILWWIISPESFFYIWNNQPIFWGIIGTLALVLFAIFLIKKAPFSRDALISFLPIVAISTFVNIFNKMSMNQGSIEEVIFYYIFIQAFLNGSTNLVLLLRDKNKKDFPKLFSKHVVKAGVFVIFTIILLSISKNYAMKFTPNPAYVQAISYLSAVWATIFNWIRKFKDESNIWAEFLLIVSALSLIILTKL